MSSLALQGRGPRFDRPRRRALQCSHEFRQYWARHDVRFHVSGVKRHHHRDVGDLALNYERLNLAFDGGLTIITYTADTATRSAEALGLLGSLAATTAAEKTSSTS